MNLQNVVLFLNNWCLVLLLVVCIFRMYFYIVCMEVLAYCILLCFGYYELVAVEVPGGGRR